MIIKYKNEKEDWEEIYKYINKQKLNFSKIRVLVLSILSGIALYMVIYTLFDYVYRIIFACIYSILSCIIGIIVFNKYLYKTIEDTMDIDESKITLDAKLKEDLELDSLDSVELIMSAEEEFGIEIPDEDVMNFKTVNDIVTYIEEHK